MFWYLPISQRAEDRTTTSGAPNSKVKCCKACEAKSVFALQFSQFAKPPELLLLRKSHAGGLIGAVGSGRHLYCPLISETL